MQSMQIVYKNQEKSINLYAAMVEATESKVIIAVPISDLSFDDDELFVEFWEAETHELVWGAESELVFKAGSLDHSHTICDVAIIELTK